MLLRRLIAGLIFGSALIWPAVAADNAAPIPDFSGMWGRNAFNFEDPPSGPRPVTNMRRVGKDAGVPIIVGDPIPLVGDYTNPILKPQAAEVLKRKGEISASGRDFPDPSNGCAPHSPPFILQMQLGVQFLQANDRVTLVYNQDHQVRHVYLNVPHAANVKPSWYGESVGHYEGDTLVVDTVGIKVGPVTMVDRFGTPQSEAMHLIERYRLIDGRQAQEAQERHEKTAGRVGEQPAPFDPAYDKGLQIEVTIDDPNVFTTPWSANLTYRRVTRPWTEVVCAENNTDVLHQGFERVPQADKPDF
jgi:hypothetical protein